MGADYSRLLLLGEALTVKGGSSLLERLASHVTVVTVDPDVPEGTLCARTLVTTLRRLPGMVVVDPTGLEARICEALAEASNAIDPASPIRIGRDRSPRAFRVHVGPSNPAAHLRIVPDGYGAHIASDPAEPILASSPANAVGAIYTAALGATEVFKHQAQVRPERRSEHAHLRFCPVSLGADLAAVPPLLAFPPLDLGLIGLGAIGTGIALILSELPLEGTVLLVDPEAYAPENLATYSLGGNADVVASPPKTLVAAAALRTFTTRRRDLAVADLITEIDRGAEVLPRIILAGVDSREARHDVQRLWPTRLIDAGTSRTMGGVADIADADGPCLMCLYPTPRGGEASEARLARLSGLPIQRCRQGSTLLAEQDLLSLTDRQRQRLRPHVGKLVCGLLDALDLTGTTNPTYQPAVAFVSLQAACLSVSRLLAYLLHAGKQPNFVQYDALIGPQNATRQLRRPAPACYCQTHGDVIQAVRDLRYGRGGRQAG